jgi:protein-disulfide isomerase
MNKKRQVFEVGSTVLVVACAVAMVGMTAYRFSSVPGGPQVSHVEDWREKSASGIWVGQPDAEFVVTTFIDFTCPYCRTLAPVLDSLASRHGDRVAVVMHHYPLGGTWSTPSAIAAECAHHQGRFREVVPALYGEVAASGDTSPDWASVAEAGGVPRIDEFVECIELPEDAFPRIAEGRAVGQRTGVRGTPTVWLNGTPTDVRDLAGFEELLEGS